MTNPNLQTLLDTLERCRQRGDGRWSARCPAHEDKGPSLSIRETGDGTILVHCFAGCPTEAVVAAAGLELSDLFPPRDSTSRPLRPGERWIPKDVLAAVSHEALVALIAARDLQAGHALTDATVERLSVATARLSDAAAQVGAHV